MGYDPPHVRQEETVQANRAREIDVKGSVDTRRGIKVGVNVAYTRGEQVTLNRREENVRS